MKKVFGLERSFQKDFAMHSIRAIERETIEKEKKKLSRQKLERARYSKYLPIEPMNQSDNSIRNEDTFQSCISQEDSNTTFQSCNDPVISDITDQSYKNQNISTISYHSRQNLPDESIENINAELPDKDMLYNLKNSGPSEIDLLKGEISLLKEEINLLKTYSNKIVTNSLNCSFSIDRTNLILNLNIPAENFDKFKTASKPISLQEEYIRKHMIIDGGFPLPIIEFHDTKTSDRLFPISANTNIIIYRELVTSEKGQRFVTRREWSPTTTKKYMEDELNQKCFRFITSLQYIEDKYFYTNPIISCKDNQSINLSNFNRN